MNKTTVLWTLTLILFTFGSRVDATQQGLPQPIVANGLGVNIHLTHFAPDELQKFKDAGFGFIRMDLIWSAIERTRGVYDFSAYDTLLSDLDKANARALLIFDYGNSLYDGGLSPYTDSGQSAFAGFAAAAAKHFANRGVIWEIWNEPNIGFWKPKASVEDYAALVKCTVKTVRKADPKATILAGATSGLPQEYIQALLSCGAMAGIDALSVHPYRGGNPETAAQDYARIRALIARYTGSGQPFLPIVCSEWGYTTAEKGVSEQRQAEYVLREYLSNLAAGVNLTIIYDWKNDGPDPKNGEHRFGTLKQDLTPKPAYLAVKDFVQSLRGYTFRHRLATDNPQDYELLFEGPRDIALVDWSADKNAQPNMQMPRITRVAPGDAMYFVLKHAASVRFAPDVRIAMTRPIVAANIQVSNPDNVSAKVEFSSGQHTMKLSLKPHETQSASLNLAVDLDGPSQQSLDLKIKWNGRPLDVIAPLVALQSSLLDLSAGPAGQDLYVTLRSPLPSSFNGRLIARTLATGKSTSRPIAIAPGAQATLTLPGASAGPITLEVLDNAGLSWARQTISAFMPFPGWPPSNPPATQFKRVPYVDNHPLARTQIDSFDCPAGSPATCAMAVPYDTASGWRYLTVEPAGADSIPANVKALTIWVNGDATGASLRNRYTDSTGQTFQFDGVGINWTGWKQVTFPLDGDHASHWGGADDGVIHPPLHWSALVLIDGSGMAPHTGRLLLAAPSYAQK